MTTIDWVVISWVSTVVMGTSILGWFLMWRLARQAMHNWTKAETAVIAMARTAAGDHVAFVRAQAEAKVEEGPKPENLGVPAQVPRRAVGA